jgi:hypothetical protein
MFVWIRPDGAVRFVYDDALRGLLALGQPTIRRASHVEPTPDGQWTADLDPMDGPVVGPFETRAAAQRPDAVPDQNLRPGPARARDAPAQAAAHQEPRASRGRDSG